MSIRRMGGFVFPKDTQAASTYSYRKTGNIAHPVGWGKVGAGNRRGGGVGAKRAASCIPKPKGLY